MEKKTIYLLKADEGKVIRQISKNLTACSIMLSETDSLDDFEEIDAPVEEALPEELTDGDNSRWT